MQKLAVSDHCSAVSACTISVHFHCRNTIILSTISLPEKENNISCILYIRSDTPTKLKTSWTSHRDAQIETPGGIDWRHRVERIAHEVGAAKVCAAETDKISTWAVREYRCWSKSYAESVNDFVRRTTAVDRRHGVEASVGSPPNVGKPGAVRSYVVSSAASPPDVGKPSAVWSYVSASTASPLDVGKLSVVLSYVSASVASPLDVGMPSVGQIYVSASIAESFVTASVASRPDVGQSFVSASITSPPFIGKPSVGQSYVSASITSPPFIRKLSAGQSNGSTNISMQEKI
ncbi:PREDICTED: uncharacterized protein LOC106116107 [Papilio xuthus]|uniref:Uncharacterized protein LOC106116107 n=1 Tax=Papilio xuthus TaxID=66420 RepID=A0AAJ7E6U0_PAPXU|nr:PREDICTED: uncharacterized protein LOC106116107 [Papilio xuthus]